MDGTPVPDTATADGAMTSSATTLDASRSAETHSLSVVEGAEAMSSPPPLSDLSEGIAMDSSFLGFTQQPESRSLSPCPVGLMPPPLPPGESKKTAKRRRQKLARDMKALTLSATPGPGTGSAPEMPSPSPKRARSPGGTPDFQTRNQCKKPRVGSGSYAGTLKRYLQVYVAPLAGKPALQDSNLDYVHSLCVHATCSPTGFVCPVTINGQWTGSRRA